MTALRLMQLSQPTHSQCVQRRDGVAQIAALNIADRVVVSAKQLGHLNLRQRHGFAQRAEFSGGHGSERLVNLLRNVIAAGLHGKQVGLQRAKPFNAELPFDLVQRVDAPVCARPSLRGLGDGVAFVGGHLNLSSMGLTALMNADYSENIGMASGNSEKTRKKQSQIITRRATQ